MRAVRMVLFAEGRHRWRAWLALALLVALVSGVVTAAATAARRTNSAFPRFVQSYGFDSLAYSYQPIKGLSLLPEVASSVLTSVPATGTPRCACAPINPSYFAVSEVTPAERHRVLRLVSGRLPDPSSPTEVLASFSLADQAGLHIGSTITVPFYAPDQQAAASGQGGAPAKGPKVTFRVVGIEAAEYDFPSIGTPTEELWTTPAFAHAYDAKIFMFHLTFVVLRGGSAAQGRFQADATRLGALGFGDEDAAVAAIESSLRPQSVGWWLLAALAGAAGLLALAQAFGRQSRVASETYPPLSALGLAPGQLVALNIGRALLIGLAGAAGGVVLAVALSPLTPVGEARQADPSTGLYVDPPVIGVAIAATVLGTLLVSLWPAIRTARLRDDAAYASRSSGIVNWLAARGAPPAAVVGVRRALERGQGRSAVPVGTALIGTVAAVLALTATTVFGASLSHLIATPSLYGQRFDVYFSNNSAPTANQTLLGPLLSQLRHDPAIAAVTLGGSAEISIDHHGIEAIAGTPLRGPLLLSRVDGRLPDGPHQIALGETTLHQVGASIGSVVRATLPTPGGGSRTVAFRVVGTVSLPTDFGISGLGSGAVFSFDGMLDAQCAGASGSAACQQLRASETKALLVAGKPGPQGRAAVARYVSRYRALVNEPVAPTNLVNFGEAVNFPLIIGFVLGLFGAATLLHMLVVSASRRRPETGLLKALGFLRSQVAAAVAWQSTVVALVGVVFGVPFGIALGEAVWRAFAHTLGVVPQPVVDVWVVAAVAAGVVALANLLALGPALASARLRPAELLRIE